LIAYVTYCPATHTTADVWVHEVEPKTEVVVPVGQGEQKKLPAAAV